VKSIPSGATGSASFTWTVARDTVTVTNPGNQTSYANAQVGLQLSASSSDGFTPLTWGSADLPADLFINSPGLITGQVPHNSTYPITVTATDAGAGTPGGQLVSPCQYIKRLCAPI
jgi:hypothetical protein